MTRRFQHDDDWENEEEETLTIECPHCHRAVYEDAEQCPYCHHYISDEDSPPARNPPWVILAAILCLCLIMWMMFG